MAMAPINMVKNVNYKEKVHVYLLSKINNVRGNDSIMS